MSRLKSKFFGLIIAGLIATLMACSPSEKRNDDASAILDTLNYGKQDYDSMRAYFNANTRLLSRLNQGIEVGDTNAMKMKKLLATEYESRAETGVSESEIDAAIFSYYTSKTVIEKFKEIDSRLPKTDHAGDSLRSKLDSLTNALKKLTKDAKQD